MKKINLVLIPYISILLFGCVRSHTTTLPYKVNDYLYMPVVIDGHTFNFIFDTGASYSVLNYRVAKKLGIHPNLKSKIGIYTHGAEFRDTVYYAERDMWIGDMKFEKVSLLLDHYNRSLGFEEISATGFDGIIGVNEIKTKNWLFDLKSKTVTISNKQIEENLIESSRDLCWEINPDSSYTFVDILMWDSIKKTFSFDTGWSTLTKADFNGKEYCLQTGIMMTESLCKAARPIMPITGHMQFVSGIKMNNLQLDTLSVMIAEVAAPLAYLTALRDSNVIGLSFLDNFEYMLYDCHKKQIRFNGFHENNQEEKDLVKAIFHDKELQKSQNYELNK